MAEDLLRRLQTTGLDDRLCERVAEHLRVDPRADPPAKRPQLRLERRVGQRPPAARQPGRVAGLAQPALLTQVRANTGQNSSAIGTRCSSRAPFNRTVIVPER